MTGEEGTRVSVGEGSGKFPRLKDYQVEAAIARCEYLVHGKLTICILTTVNGFILQGTSACVDPRNFNEDLGRKLAREKAKDKLWELEGYLLQQKLFESGQVPQRY